MLIHIDTDDDCISLKTMMFPIKKTSDEKNIRVSLNEISIKKSIRVSLNEISNVILFKFPWRELLTT
jgi:hypothetical protein